MRVSAVKFVRVLVTVVFVHSAFSSPFTRDCSVKVQLTPLSWSAKAATCHSFSPSTVFWPLRRLPMVPPL